MKVENKRNWLGWFRGESRATKQSRMSSKANRSRVLVAMRHKVEPEPTDMAERVESFRDDSEFSFGIRVFRSLISTQRLSIDIEGDVDDGMANRLRENLEFAWYRSLRHALDALEYGRSIIEWRARYRESEGIVLVDYVGYLPYEWTKIILDEKGIVTHIRVGDDGEYDESGRPKWVDLPSGSVWLVTINDTPKKPFGESIYEGAPTKLLKIRHEQEENENKWYRKNAIGIGVAKAPRSYNANSDANAGGYGNYGTVGETDASGNNDDPMEDLKRMMEDIDGGGIAVVESGNYSSDDGGGELYQFVSMPQVNDSSAIEARRKSLDDKAFRSLGIPERAITLDEDGSRAASQTHLQVLWDVAQGFADQILESFQSQIANKVAFANFGSAARLSLSLTPIGDTTESELKEIVKAIVLSPSPSPLVTSGVVDFEEMLGQTDIPVGQNASEALAKISTQPSPAFGPSQFSTPNPPIPPDEHTLEQALLERINRRREELLEALSEESKRDRRRL